jgi:Tfp pilus assembly protein PilF
MKLRLHLCLCCAALLSGQTRDAYRHFKNGEQLFKTHDDSGEALVEAEQEFRHALRNDPNFAAAQAYLGLIALEAQHKDEARIAFETALRMNPACPEARVGLAQLAMNTGHWQEGVAILRRAVSEAPRNRMALDQLAAALTAENHPIPGCRLAGSDALLARAGENG